MTLRFIEANGLVSSIATICPDGWVRGVEGPEPAPKTALSSRCKGCSNQCFPPISQRKRSLTGKAVTTPTTTSMFGWRCVGQTPQCSVVSVSGPLAGSSALTRVGSIVRESRCTEAAPECGSLRPRGSEPEPSGGEPVVSDALCPPGMLRNAQGVCVPYNTGIEDESNEIPAESDISTADDSDTKIPPVLIGAGAGLALLLILLR